MFNRSLIQRKRGRGAVRTDDPFLLHHAADEALERILDTSRNYERALVFGAPAFTERLIAKAGPQKIQSFVRADFSDLATHVDYIADEAALPFADNTFDLLVNGLTLHVHNDPQAVLAEFLRVLKPDGFLLSCLFGGASLTELRQSFYHAEEQFSGQVSPRVIPMIELSTASALLHSGGFALPVADRETLTIDYRHFGKLVGDLRRMGETNSLISRSQTFLPRIFWQELEASYRDRFSKDGQSYQATFEIIWLSGWKPHPDQPRPLKPGSGKTRLADALGVKEIKL